MSKIKIEEIESVTTASPNSGDLTITPDGSGVFEVAGEDDNGSLQLNTINQTNNIKIKSPSSSVAQNYTMILPATSPTADKFLKVDSISGSGATAVGQLGYHTQTPADLTQLNANNFDSGTIGADRYSITGSQGGGYQLIQKAEPSTSTSEVIFSNLAVGMYKLMMTIVGNNAGRPKMNWLNSSGSAYSSLNLGYYWCTTSTDSFNASGGQTNIDFYDNVDRTLHYHECEINIGTPTNNHSNPNLMMAKGFTRNESNSATELFVTFGSSNYTDRIHGLKIFFADGGTARTLEQGTKILLYKYNET
jgi:hypothetical protein